MTVSKHATSATLLVDAGYDLGIVGGNVTLDESWAPYAQASLDIAMPSETVAELLDPREDRRIEISVSADYPLSDIPSQTRTFNLGLRERTIDHEAGTIRLDLSSDEALLMDKVLVSDEPIDYWDHRASLRAIINAALAEVGAALEPGTDDADMTPHWNVTNLFPNPSGETNTGYWALGGNSSNLTSSVLSSPTPILGTDTIRWTAIAAGTSFAVAGANSGTSDVVRVTPGNIYTAALHTVTSGTQRPMSIDLRFYAENGTTVLKAYSTTPVTPPSAVFVRHVVSGQAPVGAAYAAILIRAENSNAGQAHWADAAMIYEGSREINAYDGDTADDANYTYEWDGTAHASQSRRVALVPSDPDALLWNPGESLWEFLQPLFQSAGMRLFCDEQQRWYLVNGSEYIAPGHTQLAYAVNLTRAEDAISRDSEEWFDAAVVEYRWTDADGIVQSRFDTYAEPDHTRTRSIVIDKAYPGPGFARYMVKRARGKGRTLDLAAVSQYTVTPSQPVSASLPLAPVQTGVVRSVSWGLSECLMVVQTRGLTDTPDTAWLFLPAGEAWTDSPVGESWTEETIGA